MVGRTDPLDDARPEFLGGDVGVVLRRDHDGAHTLGHAPLVLHGHLGLAIRAQVGQLTTLAHGGQLARHPVGERDGQGHQLGRLA